MSDIRITKGLARYTSNFTAPTSLQGATMATNFPNSPSNGATHTFGGTTYI